MSAFDILHAESRTVGFCHVRYTTKHSYSAELADRSVREAATEDEADIIVETSRCVERVHTAVASHVTDIIVVTDPPSWVVPGANTRG